MLTPEVTQVVIDEYAKLLRRREAKVVAKDRLARLTAANVGEARGVSQIATDGRQTRNFQTTSPGLARMAAGMKLPS